MTDSIVTLQDYKNYKSINSTNFDTQISYLIDSIGSIVENYCGRSFVKYYDTNKTEYGNSKENVMFLTEIPVIEVISVKVSANGGVDQTLLTENTDYFVDSEQGLIISAYCSFLESYITHKSLEVIYKGGYEEIPTDLKTAIFDFIDYYRKEEFTPRKAMDTASIQHISSQDSQRIPAHIRRILDFYRVNV